MDIYLYNINVEPNKLDKAPFDELHTIGTLREECSIINPIVTLEQGLAIRNYAYIPDFNRYYYITNITLVSNNLARYELSCDVLMTYRDQLRQLSAVVRRQQNVFNLYLDDPNFKVYNNNKTQTVIFPNGFSNDYKFLLTVAGGGN